MQIKTGEKGGIELEVYNEKYSLASCYVGQDGELRKEWAFRQIGRDKAADKATPVKVYLGTKEKEDQKLNRHDEVMYWVEKCKELEAENAKLTAERDRMMLNIQERKWIDMTPNEGLADRILSAYIDNTIATDNTAGLPPENELCKLMNKNSEQRNELIAKARKALAGEGSHADRP